MGLPVWLAALLLAAPRVASPDAPPAERPQGLRLEYETRGVFPGGDEDSSERRARQVITVDATGQRLLLLDFDEVGPPSRKAPAGESTAMGTGGGQDGGQDAGEVAGEVGATRLPGDGPQAPTPEWALRRKLILRMDLSPPTIYEVLPGAKEYREHAGDLNDLQKDRRIAEENERRLVAGYSEADRKAHYKRYWWLRPDGSREVKVTRDQGKTVLGAGCEHLKVIENGREIIDAQIARVKVGAGSYYQLYRRLGAFSEEVLEKIKDVEGFPLEGRITIVTALPTRTIEFEATALALVDLDPTIFELPPGASRVEDIPDRVSCGQCGKEIEGGGEEASAKIRELDGRWVYFCTEECAEAYVRKKVPTKAGPKR